MNGVVLRLNRPKVICEAFDDEVVAINLETGTYFGMLGTAKDVWKLIESEVPEENLTDHLAECYGIERHKIAADVEAFVESLVEQALVSRVPADGPGPAVETMRPAGSWAAPKLAVYDDMKDLLLLDPIHDVDETGWPARKQDCAQ